MSTSLARQQSSDTVFLVPLTRAEIQVLYAGLAVSVQHASDTGVVDEHRSATTKLREAVTDQSAHTGSGPVDVLVRDRDRFGEALEVIRDTDPVDNALDPQRAPRIARAALAGEE